MSGCEGVRVADVAAHIAAPVFGERMRSAGVTAESAAARLGERLRLIGVRFGPMLRPATQADRDGLLITRHFQYADAMGVSRERAMEILRDELWSRGRPMVDRVRAATERLSREEP